MKGLDTNVLLRFLMRDDEEQWQIADRFVRAAIQAGKHCFINNIVLCEAVWVMSRAYGLSREEIVEALENILSGSQFEFEDRGTLLLALQQMKAGRADFADYLIGAVNEQAGCDETATFDRKLKGAEKFRGLYYSSDSWKDRPK
ncbi:PIN domain-containing protein [Synechococcus sp. PCC 7336]|uniref:PIN domain-containing protein n=1 Tax=Synechococcus sp. PCC 7336 TaxID=195250 RepID=UPI000378E8F7|nr:type II toxin-antitoxin system VapC family toxin [Synechococcus sp. PCC 7336]